MRVLFPICFAAVFGASQALAQPELEEEIYEDDVEEVFDLEEEEEEPEPEALDLALLVTRAIDARKGEISGPAYEFCTDAEYEPDTFRAKRHCKLVGPEMEKICPAAARICFEEPEKPPFRLPDGLLYTLLAIALLVLGGGLSWFFITLLRQWRNRDDTGFEIEMPGPIPVGLETLPDTGALILLQEAELQLAAGRSGHAALLVHVAALRHFEDAGLISFHASTTNGEYLRSLRPHPEYAALFRTIARITDRLRFGDGAVDGAAVERLIGEARRLFARPSSRPLAGAGTAAGLLLILGASACDAQDTSFFSHKPEGLAALPALIEKAGVSTKVVRRLPEEIPPDTGVVVMRSDFGFQRILTAKDVDALLDADLAVIVLDDIHDVEALLPLTSTVSMSALVTHPEAVNLSMTDAYFCRFDQAYFAATILDPIPGAFMIPSGFTHIARTSSDAMSMAHRTAELVPMLVYADSPADVVNGVAHGALRVDKVGEYKAGCLVVFSTSEVFSNAALTHAKNTAYAVGLIGALLEPGETVLFVDALETGSGGGGKVASSLSNSKMLPLILHLGLWVAVLFVSMGAAFGRLRDPVRTEHKAFLEHAQAVGLYYAASGPAGRAHAAEALARLVVARYRGRVRGTSEEAWADLALHLAERQGLDRQEVLSALSFGLEEELRQTLQKRTAALDPVRALEVLSAILAGETPADQKR